MEQKRQAQRWRFTVEDRDSGGDSSLQQQTAFWSKRDRHRDGDSLAKMEIRVEIHLCSRKLRFEVKETGTEMEIHCRRWRFRWGFISAAGNCMLEQKRQAQQSTFTNECKDSSKDSCLQQGTAFWSKRDRHRDGDSLSKMEIQVEIHLCSRKLHVGAKETGTEMEIHCQRWRFGWRFTLHQETAFWSKRDRQRDGDLLLNVEIQVEIHVCRRKRHFGA